MGRDSNMLEVNSVFVNYGRLAALRGVSMHVQDGEIVCNVGPNGAGKSTLLRCIAGGVNLKSGTIKLDGVDITGLSPENISRRGVSFVPEGHMIFSTLTTEENLRLATLQRRNRNGVKRDVDRILELFPKLRERLNVSAGRLSGGEQQMLSIGRALLTSPRLMMIDEPSLGLAPKIIDRVYEVLVELRETENLTLLINEQSSERILRLADRIYVLVNGQIRLHGKATQLRHGDAIFKAYFGLDPSHARAAR
jgi:branched-chain amino acid transport system ATP-binding protein